MGIDPGVSRLGGEIVCHNTTDARHVQTMMEWLKEFLWIILNMKLLSLDFDSLSGIAKSWARFRILYVVFFFRREETVQDMIRIGDYCIEQFFFLRFHQVTV